TSTRLSRAVVRPLRRTSVTWGRTRCSAWPTPPRRARTRSRSRRGRPPSADVGPSAAVLGRGGRGFLGRRRLPAGSVPEAARTGAPVPVGTHLAPHLGVLVRGDAQRVV